MELEQLLRAFSSAGDAGAAGLGYAVGFVVDALWFPGGVSSGTAAAVGAVAALGAKKSVEALRDEFRHLRASRREKAEQERRLRESQPKPIEERVTSFRKLLVTAGMDQQVGILDTEVEFWRNELTDDGELEGMMRSLMREYRLAESRRNVVNAAN